MGTDLTEIFSFWNRSIYNKWFPRRKLLCCGRKNRKNKLVICEVCGNKFPVFAPCQTLSNRVGSQGRSGGYFRKCRACLQVEIESELCEARCENRRKANELIRSFEDALEDCTKFGTCDILYAHHEVLKDDPERLSTDFLMGMVCGPERVREYRKKAEMEG